MIRYNKSSTLTKKTSSIIKNWCSFRLEILPPSWVSQCQSMWKTNYSKCFLTMVDHQSIWVLGRYHQVGLLISLLTFVLLKNKNQMRFLPEKNAFILGLSQTLNTQIHQNRGKVSSARSVPEVEQLPPQWGLRVSEERSYAYMYPWCWATSINTASLL